MGSGSRWWYVLLVLTGVATGLVVVLALQSRALRRELRDVRREASLPPLGLRVPPITAVTLAGDTAVLGRGTPRILLFFTTTCAVCRQAVPLWNQLLRRSSDSPAAFDIWALGAESAAATGAFAEDVRIEPRIALVDTMDFLAYRVGAVPLAVVVSPDGRILFRRAGVPSSEALDSIVVAASAAAATPVVRVGSLLSGGGS